MDIGNIFEEWDFSGTVPLPYRVLLMGCIGIFAWASNLQILSHLRVDVSNLLFSSPPLSGIYTNHPRHSRTDKYINKSTPISALYRAIYALGAVFLAMVLINMWMYKWVVSGSDPKNQVDSANLTTGDIRGGMGQAGNPRIGIMVPILGYLTVLVMIFIPFNTLFKKERYRFLRSMKKALFSGFKSEVSFADVILADILTSFARVFGDLAVAICLMFFNQDGTNADACYGSILVPIMTSIPYCIRLRQCLSEYIESNYTTERHLMNALKYASAFPVIIISSMQKSSKAASLKGLPLFFVALNSFYSFYWDIYHDWNLIQMQPQVTGRIPTLTLNTASGSGISSVHSRPNSSPLSPSTPKIGSISKSDISNIGNSNSNNSNTNGNNINNNNNGGKVHGSPLLGSSSNSSGNSSSNNAHNNSTHSNNNNSAAFSKKKQQLGMRSYLHYEDQLFYIMAVILDFLLRTTWMLKLVSNIQIEEYEGGVFTMECLEVLRRWIWVLFRLESEMVKRAGYTDASLSGVGGAGGDISMLDNIEGDENTIMMEDLETWQK
ncbi:protein-ER retention protein [Entomortierella lignicola]|nr:protein-ER retention protein [Entomortierella lignicola]